MNNIGRIMCYGHCKAPAESWHLTKHHGINRLYYIHSGTGGYIHNKKTYNLESGCLYYIPYLSDFTPFCSSSDPTLHTYIDFELIPPIITKNILKLNTFGNEKLLAAVKIFEVGGKNYYPLCSKIDDNQREKFFWKLCSSNILFLISEITKANGVSPLEDALIIKAIEIMHSRISDNISVREIANICHINEDSFIRRFSKTIGATPYSYLKNLRVRTALNMRDNGFGLAEIAHKTGYSDASSLLHALKHYDN